jgi:hypothetical protein
MAGINLDELAARLTDPAALLPAPGAVFTGEAAALQQAIRE